MSNPVIVTAAQFGDAVDTYYTYVRSRFAGIPESSPGAEDGFAAIDAGRIFGGIITAESWPPKSVQPEAFYLTVINQFPGRRGTVGNREYRDVLQWTWLTQGTDINQAQIGLNRGDRYRLDQTMRNQLYAANFPQYCPLISVSFNETSGAIVRTPYNPVRMARWTALSFGPRPSITDDSGVLYGAAAVDVYSFRQPLTQ